MEAHQRRPRIVLADDNFTTQQVLRLSFAGEEVDIECCDSGQAALKEIAAEATDVLLANVYLPDMDGYELCRQLYADGLGATRTIMLVGAFQTFDEERARSVGCLHSLSKPFDTFSLVSLVTSLISAPAEPEPVPPAPEESTLLFEPTLSSVGTEMVFDLTLPQCRGLANHLAREVSIKGFPKITASDEATSYSEPQATTPAATIDHQRLVEILSERVPEAIKNLLPDIVRELDESS